VTSTGTPSKPSFTIRWREGTTHRRESGFTRRTDAMEAIARIRVGLGDGTLVERRRAGIGFDTVARQWLELHSKATLRSHSLNAMNYAKHVEPFFGNAPLAAVTATRLLEFRAKTQAAGLSPRTTNLLLALTRAILKFAVSNGHLTASPTDRLGRGKLMLPIEATKLAPPIERPEDVGRLLETIRAARPDRFAFFAVLVYTGMRKGEALGLRWEDIDLARRIVTVRRSYAGQTKSGSHREVPIPGRLVEILKAHRLAEPWGGELVFPADDGGISSRNSKPENVLRAALDTMKHPHIRIHDLRHVYASHFVMAGGSVYDLQKNLGHHSVAFTADVYGHLSADHRVREADRLAFDAPPEAEGRVIELPQPTRKAGKR
jgi:integrase